MKIFQKPIPALLYRHLAALLTVVLTNLVLLPLRPYLSIQTIVLIFLLPVLVSTMRWGLTPGVLAAFSAFLIFNYYYIEPFHTFEVHATQDLISLIIFLIVSVMTSQLIGQAQDGIRLARRREWEATHMYELISALAGLQHIEAIAQVLAAQAQETFQCQHVEVTIFANKTMGAYTTTLPDEVPPHTPPKMRISLKTARSLEGELRLWLEHLPLSEEEARLLEASCSQAALALERVRLMQGENKARVLEESDRLKSSLLNSVSHELRSPLAAIKASVSSLRSGAVEWDTSARQELLATIEEETDHLNYLVGNLLDMSRIESGSLQPHKRWNAIGEILMGVVIKMRKQLQDHRLEIDLPEHLPLVPTDYVMVEQVFTNLLSNSIKYAPPGTLIHVSGREEDEYLHMQVSNQSPPVPEEHLLRIFDTFYRVTAADRVTGTGLGLSICKGIIEAHGGRIWAENADNSFVFHFLLPLKLNGALPESPKEVQDG